jgi:hypothetical protein
MLQLVYANIHYFLCVNLFTSIQCRDQEWWSYSSTPPYAFVVWSLIS